MRNKKGFTLVEVLLIIMLVGILLTSALTSYFNSAKTFNFLEAYKSTILPIRTARGYALSNKDGGEILKYGLRITDDCVGFLELGEDDNPFALEGSRYVNRCKDYNNDQLIDFPDFLNNEMTIDFGSSDYQISIPGAKEEKLPIYVFFETGNGTLTAFHDVRNGSKTPIAKDTDDGKDIWLSVSDLNNPDLEQYIVILTVSGLVEEVSNLPEPDTVTDLRKFN
jgi:type II secretory pathway pseudopilin PulG